MTVETPGGGALVERAKAIILRPREEWPVIARETTPSGDVFTRYAVPLAAIGPVASFLGGQLFGFGGWGFSIRPSFSAGLSMAIGGFVLALVSLFLVSFIAGWIAPRFGGEANSRNAFRLVVYAMTASWVAGIFGLVPSLSFLSILGLYSFYLFYVGAGPILKVPADKALTYTIVTALAVILISVCIAAVTAAIGRMVAGPSTFGGTVTTLDGTTITVPGMGTIDAGKVEEAARGLQEAASGNGNAVAPADLQALLPASIGAYRRIAVESVRAGPGSQAEATYEAGDRRFTLKVADMAFLGAMAGMAGTLGVEANKEDADGYERATTRDGNLIVEKWDRSAEDGRYATMVDKRFLIEAEGKAGSIDELKAAVATISTGKLAALGGR